MFKHSQGCTHNREMTGLADGNDTKNPALTPPHHTIQIRPQSAPAGPSVIQCVQTFGHQLYQCLSTYQSSLCSGPVQVIAHRNEVLTVTFLNIVSPCLLLLNPQVFNLWCIYCRGSQLSSINHKAWFTIGCKACDTTTVTKFQRHMALKFGHSGCILSAVKDAK